MQIMERNDRENIRIVLFLSRTEVYQRVYKKSKGIDAQRIILCNDRLAFLDNAGDHIDI